MTYVKTPFHIGLPFFIISEVLVFFLQINNLAQSSYEEIITLYVGACCHRCNCPDTGQRQ